MTGTRLRAGPSEVEAGFCCTGSNAGYKSAVKGEQDVVEGVGRGVFKLQENPERARYRRQDTSVRS